MTDDEDRLADDGRSDRVKRIRKREIPRGEPVLSYPEGIVVCPGCGIGFVPLRSSAVYCSTKCRVKVFERSKAG